MKLALFSSCALVLVCTASEPAEATPSALKTAAKSGGSVAAMGNGAGVAEASVAAMGNGAGVAENGPVHKAGAGAAAGRRRFLPPEAFTVPTNFVVLVSVGGAVDAEWLAGEAAAMQRSLQYGVKAAEAPALKSLDAVRDAALDLLGSDTSAKLALFVVDAPGFPPVAASPYEGWAVVDAGWVRRGEAETAELEAERLGKRIWQGLGALCGASYRPEREAVMRYCPTPRDLDDCLSHNFHPLNANSFSIVAKSVGLDRIRMRPREELVRLGILKPRQRPAEPPKAQ